MLRKSERCFLLITILYKSVLPTISDNMYQTYYPYKKVIKNQFASILKEPKSTESGCLAPPSTVRYNLSKKTFKYSSTAIMDTEAIKVN